MKIKMLSMATFALIAGCSNNQNCDSAEVKEKLIHLISKETLGVTDAATRMNGFVPEIAAASFHRMETALSTLSLSNIQTITERGNESKTCKATATMQGRSQEFSYSIIRNNSEYDIEVNHPRLMIDNLVIDHVNSARADVFQEIAEKSAKIEEEREKKIAERFPGNTCSENLNIAAVGESYPLQTTGEWIYEYDEETTLKAIEATKDADVSIDQIETTYKFMPGDDGELIEYRCKATVSVTLLDGTNYSLENFRFVARSPSDGIIDFPIEEIAKQTRFEAARLTARKIKHGY